jgi:phage-related protein
VRWRSPAPIKLFTTRTHIQVVVLLLVKSERLVCRQSRTHAAWKKAMMAELAESQIESQQFAQTLAARNSEIVEMKAEIARLAAVASETAAKSGGTTNISLEALTTHMGRLSDAVVPCDCESAFAGVNRASQSLQHSYANEVQLLRTQIERLSEISDTVNKKRNLVTDNDNKHVPANSDDIEALKATLDGMRNDQRDACQTLQDLHESLTGHLQPKILDAGFSSSIIQPCESLAGSGRLGVQSGTVGDTANLSQAGLERILARLEEATDGTLFFLRQENDALHTFVTQMRTKLQQVIAKIRLCICSTSCPLLPPLRSWN